MKRGKTYGGYLLLIGLMVLAFWLRLHNISAFSFWTDEGLTPLRSSYSIAQILRNEIIIQGVITKDTHPPFYYLTIHALRPLFGETDLAYRYPSLLASLLLLPLLYQFGRRLGGRGMGWVAAGLTAVNPLHVWYANEARMYSLYVLLMAGAAYALWRALSGGELRRWLPFYLLLAGLGLYTHYTAVFLIAFQAPFWVWLLWRQGQQKLIIGAGLLGLLAAIPLIPVTLPRLFTGAEAHYSYVSPIIMFQDVVRFFGLGMTMDFHQMGSQLLILIALGLLLLGLVAAGGWKPRVFLFSYLLAVVFGLMAGSLLKPMYQGVRHIMVGSPAFLLLSAWGLCFAWAQSWRKTAVRPLWIALFVIGALAALIGPAVALHNLYNRHDLYAKDDFRALIRSIERQAGGNDVVIHNNAILLPLHAHYQRRADLPVTAVPRYPTHAADAEPDLLALVESYDRIWLVTDPPADDRDNERLVQRWLASELHQIAALGAHSRHGIVEALAFSATPLVMSGLPAEARPLDTQWPELPTLRGITLADAPPITRPTLWFALFWEGGDGPPPATLRFSLQDQTGREWFSANHPLQPDASKTWPEVGLARLEYALSPPPGLPPGDYHLLVEPLDGGSPASLATLPFAATDAAGAGPLALSRRIHFANGLRLAGWEAADLGVRPGHTLPLTLYWLADAPLSLEGLRYELTVLEPDGDTLREQSDRPGAAWLPEIAPGTLVREQTGVYIRPDVEPGRYRLRWRLLDEGVVVPGRPFWRPWSGETITLGEIEVIPWPIETTLPDNVIRAAAAFGPAMTLYGYTLDRIEGESPQLALSLTWQAQAKPDDSYLLFVHLVSAADGTILSQADRVPGDGLRPTSGWRAGEVIRDSVILPIPAAAPPGDYRLLVGFYQPERDMRPPVMVGDILQPDGQLLLTTVTLP